MNLFEKEALVNQKAVELEERIARSDYAICS